MSGVSSRPALAAWALLTVSGALIAFHFLLPQGSSAQALVYEAVGVIAFLGALAGTVRRRSAARPYVWAIVAGLGFMAIGDAVWSAYDLVLRSEPPFPSVADASWLAGSTSYVVAILLLVRSRQRPSLSDVLDGLIVLSGSALLFWFALIEPAAADTGAGTLSRAVAAAYPSLDVLLLVAISQLLLTPGSRGFAFRVLAGGAATLLGADVVYGLQALSGSYVSGSWTDGAYMAAVALWGAATLHPSMNSLHRYAPLRDTRLTWRRLGLLGAASLVAPIVIVRYADAANTAHAATIAAGAGLTTLLVFVRMALLFREHGRAVAALRDAQARRDAAEALTAANQRFESAARALDCAIYEWSFESEHVHWTQGLASVFGYSLEDVEPTNTWFFEHVHPDDRQGLVALDDRLRAGDEVTESAYRFRDAAGGYRDVWDRWVVLRGADGTRVIGGMVDVTERKELERHYQQAQKLEAVGRLAGGIAHDFNNLLTAISGNAELLSASERLGDDDRGDVEQIRRAASRAAALTGQLLTFSRRQPPEQGTADVNEVVEDVRAMLARLLGPDVAIETKLDPVAGSVAVGALAVEQILVNLAVNARDAMPSGGSLAISTRRSEDGGSCVLTVADTGTGMDEEVLQHVFEPFFTTKPPGKGTGLGLATVYGVVEQAGGTISVTSSPGEGTSFLIRLPHAAGGAPAIVAAPAARAGTEQILVVEDEAPVRAVLARMLETQGYDVVVAEDSEQALALFEDDRFAPDLVLSDLVMPKLNGLALADAIERRRPRVRFLFISGFSGHDALGQTGCRDGRVIVQKPFSVADLSAAVRSALDDESALQLAG